MGVYIQKTYCKKNDSPVKLTQGTRLENQTTFDLQNINNFTVQNATLY